MEESSLTSNPKWSSGAPDPVNGFSPVLARSSFRSKPFTEFEPCIIERAESDRRPNLFRRPLDHAVVSYRFFDVEPIVGGIWTTFKRYEHYPLECAYVACTPLMRSTVNECSISATFRTPPIDWTIHLYILSVR